MKKYDVNQVCQYRYNILKYIYETENYSGHFDLIRNI